MLERIHANLSPHARTLLGQELRQRGLLSVWDQVDRAGPMTPVEEGVFILERLYPEMPAAHLSAPPPDAGSVRGRDLAGFPSAAASIGRSGSLRDVRTRCLTPWSTPCMGETARLKDLRKDASTC
jgi:hypothetical protein